MTEMAGNIIAESMYAHYEIDRNEGLLLGAFINHRRNGSAIIAVDQKIVVTG